MAGSAKQRPQATESQPEAAVVACRKCREEFDSVHGFRKHHALAHGEKAKRPLTCAECGDEFSEPYYVKRKYCSRECFNESQRRSPGEQETVSSICLECGDEFDHYPSHDAKYCSEECFLAETIVETCPECGDEFTRKEYYEQTYCSPECVHQSLTDSRTSICALCRKEFDRYPSEERKYCSRRCYGASQKNGAEELRRILHVESGPGFGQRYLKAHRALLDAGYETIDDIRETHPGHIRNVDHVGQGLLKRLTEEIDGFDASDYIREETDMSDRPQMEVTHCPACQKELESGEYLSHILNCDEA